MRGIVIALVGVSLATVSVSAQLAVIDPANLVQVVLIAQRAGQVYAQLQAEYQLILGMTRSLRGLDRYRTPSIALTAHDPGRWVYGSSWLQGLNTGDARGTAYFSTAIPLERPGDSLDRLGPAARRVFENRYATVEIADSAAMLGGHQVALVRGYHGLLQDAVERLQGDVLNGSSDFHQVTAILDKVSAGELLARRQDMASNQLISSALEQLLVRNKRERDTEAATVNMQLTAWRDGPAVNHAFAAGIGEALQSWRQP